MPSIPAEQAVRAFVTAIDELLAKRHVANLLDRKALQPNVRSDPFFDECDNPWNQRACKALHEVENRRLAAISDGQALGRALASHGFDSDAVHDVVGTLENGGDLAAVWPQRKVELRAAADRLNAAHDAGRLKPATPVSVEDDRWLDPVKLADAWCVPLGPLRSRLNRWRRNTLDGWREVGPRKPREPKYLYRVGAVRHIRDDMTRGARTANA